VIFRRSRTTTKRFHIFIYRYWRMIQGNSMKTIPFKTAPWKTIPADLNNPAYTLWFDVYVSTHVWIGFSMKIILNFCNFVWYVVNLGMCFVILLNYYDFLMLFKKCARYTRWYEFLLSLVPPRSSITVCTLLWLSSITALSQSCIATKFVLYIRPAILLIEC